MATKTITFTGFHPAFSDSDELGVAKEIDSVAAQKAIDLGIAYAGKPKEKATANTPTNLAVNVTDAAVEAATKQQEEAHGVNDETRMVGNDEIQGELPVGTTADGEKVLVKPEDNALEQTSAPGEKVVDDKKKK